jgi:CoA:oxalate CoA-transferase
LTLIETIWAATPVAACRHDLLASGHVEARNLIQPGLNRNAGDIKLVSQPVQFSAAPSKAPMRSPILGEDTDAVLREELGLDEDRIAALRSSKAI